MLQETHCVCKPVYPWSEEKSWPAAGTQVRWIGLLLLAGLWLVGCDRDAEPAPPAPRLVSAVQVESGTALIEGELPGRAAAVQELDLTFRVAGRLIELPARVGNSVNAGDMLAQLDRRDYEVAIEVERGRQAKARADLQVAQLNYDRGISIQRENPGAISQSIIEQRLGALDQAKAVLLSAEASLANALNALDDTTLRASFDAVIVARYVENFEEVLARDVIVRLVDVSRVKMTVQLPEQHVSRLPDVESFLCRFDAFPDRELPASVYEIGVEALETTRTYPVTLIMDQPEEVMILPGMSGKVRMRLRSGALGAEDGVVVPATAVVSDAVIGSFVWVVDAETRRVNRRSVEVGPVLRDGLLVREGLVSAEWIVTAGAHFLVEGQEVRLPSTSGGS